MIIIAIWLFFAVPGARAQRVDMSLTPPQITILMKSGVSLMKAFTLENKGDPGIFSTQVVSFEPAGDQGERILKDKAEGPIRFSLENSQFALGDKFFLRGGERVQALLNIRSVQNAPPGDYYYNLFFVAEPTTLQETAGKGRGLIGANILISITDTGFTEAEGKVSLFQVIPRYKFTLFGRTFYIIEPTDEVPVVLKVVNTGRYMVVPQAKVMLKGPLGIRKSVEMVPVNVLKSSERLLTKSEPDECRRCRIPVSAVFDGLYFGKYHLSTEIELEGATQKIFAESVFWALPVKLTGGVAFLFGASLVLWWWLGKRKGDGRKK